MSKDRISIDLTPEEILVLFDLLGETVDKAKYKFRPDDGEIIALENLLSVLTPHAADVAINNPDYHEDVKNAKKKLLSEPPPDFFPKDGRAWYHFHLKRPKK